MAAALEAAIAGWAWAGRPEAAEEVPLSSAVVLYVLDGDSFQARFSDGSESGVRLIGVNSPEMTDGRENVRFWAFLAKRFAAHHLAGKRVELDYDWEKRDVHGRLLAYVRLSGGVERLFNKLIIRSGFAYAFLKYPFREDYRLDFRQAQREARREGNGLWGKDPPPIISLEAARLNIGKRAAVGFRCAVVKERGRYLRLAPGEAGFEVMVSRDSGLDLEKVSAWADKNLTVDGILEGAPGRIRVYVLFSKQLKVE